MPIIKDDKQGGLTKTPVAQPVTGPPIPLLQQHGYHGSIDDFNGRVAAVHDSYQRAYGVPPSPGLTFDLAKSKVDTQDFNKMFTVPLSQFGARSRGALTAQGITEPPLHLTAKDITEGVMNAAKRGDYHSFVEQHSAQIHDLSQNKKNAPLIAGALFNARRLQKYRDVEERINSGEISPGQGRMELQASGFLPGGSALGKEKGAGFLLAKGIGQVADSLVHSPAGLYQLGKAAGLDTKDIVVHPTSSDHFSRTAPIGKAVVKSFANDVQHPGENPGYLFLDILGFASPVAGAGARVGEAGRLLTAGEGAGAAAKALAHKAPLRRAAVSHGSLTEEVPLSQNPLVAKAQEFIINRRQKASNKRLAGDTPSALRSILLPGAARDLLDDQLSFETKVGREADARKRVDHIVQTSLSRELDHVAGRSVTLARINARVPSKIRGSLTRGEQKAIQVHSWDDPNPLQAERDFHQRMIDMKVGDPKAHKRQLADLKLAEKAMENPSPRFQKALALTRQVVAEMEQIKIRDLGLAPETAEGRIAKAGQALRGEEQVGGKTANPDSFYLPTQPRGKGKRPPSDRQGFFSPKAGPFGIPPGRDMPELTHEFTGKAIQTGDFRIDATSLATEAYGRTVRAATVRHEHARLWDAASAKPYGSHSIPIRDVNAIPDKLREVVAKLDEGDFGPKDAEILPKDMREMLQELYPDPKKLSADEIQHVRWIDGRILGQGNKAPHVPGHAAAVSQAVQGPFRVGVLYLRPAYILNKLGNHAMGVFDEGWMWPGNYAKALSMDTRYGEEATRTIHELVGAGRSTSYLASKSGRFSQGLAEFWNRIADRGERAAAFINYAERKGYKSNEEMNSLLFDPKNRADLTEVSRRANKSLVEFDNLLPIEKNYLRHFIFVYPWVSRSAVYSLRAIMEHPTKVDLLSKLGEEDMQSDPIFKAAPAWFKRTGYVPVGWNSDGTPRVVNPTSVNTFSTLGDFVALAKSSTVGDKYASAEDFLGPLPKYLVHAVSNKDEFGNTYPDSPWYAAARDVLLQLPQVSAYQRKGNVKAGEAKPTDITDRSSLETSLNANLHKTVLTPGWLDGYGSLLAGGFAPKGVNADALAARYWADQSPEKRHRRELDLLGRALDAQGEAIAEKVPTAVRAAVTTAANIDFQYKRFLKESGRPPTDKERAGFAIDYLKQQGALSPAKAADWHKKLAPLADTSDINHLKATVLDKYANGKALRNWDSDVRTVASFKPDVFNQKAGELFKQGLVPQKRYNVGQEKLYAYGREYLKFTREVRKMQDAGSDTASLRAFEDAHDKSVNGLPSFARMAWANQTPEDQQQSIASAAARSWSDNTSFEKALLGRDSSAKVTAGWAKLKEIVDTQGAALKRDGRSFPSGYERQLAQYVERYYDAPGLVKDYDFSKKTMADRLKMLTPIQKSPNADRWGQLLAAASGYSKWLDQKNADGSRVYSSLQVRQAWQDYTDSPPFQAWLKEDPSFHEELGNYGKKFVSSLIG